MGNANDYEPGGQLFEQMVDELILDSLDVDHHVRYSTSIALACYRTFVALSKREGLPLKDFDCKFLIQHLADREINDADIREVTSQLIAAMESDDFLGAIRKIRKCANSGSRSSR